MPGPAREAARAQAAATAVLVRDRAGGLEVLMLRRSSKVAFSGLWVFPGGRIEADDAVTGDELAGARRAAVRESLEETRLAVDEGGLVPFSHWTPPETSPRRFLTWFFLARAPEGAVTVDGGEIREHAWLRPEEVFARRAGGKIELAPPTFVTLVELAQQRDVGGALDFARSRLPERFRTVLARTEGGAVALWHGDAGYEHASADRAGPRHRLWMLDDGWRYERDL